MPQLLPLGIRHPEVQMLCDAWSNLDKWTKPLLTIFSDGDPITRGGEKIFQQRIPGAMDQEHIVLTGGHFLQEDAPEEISRKSNRKHGSLSSGKDHDQLCNCRSVGSFEVTQA